MRKILKTRDCKIFNKRVIFKPLGKELYRLEQTTIFPDELEAMRLCDYEGYNQKEAGDMMKISRGTIQRLLYSGRKKLLLALLNEQAICLDNYEELKDEIFLEFRELNILEGDKKIAFPSSDGITIEEHFGKANQFIIFKLLDGKIEDRYILQLDVNLRGRYPEVLKDENITILVAYGMGNRAVALLNEFKISIKLGIYGEIDEIMFKILKGDEIDDSGDTSSE